MIDVARLIVELQTAIPKINGVDSNGVYTFTAPLTAQETTDAAAIIAAHEANYDATAAVSQQEATQAASAKTVLQSLMTGLHGLSAEDKSYAIACRIMAQKDGADNATIMSIVDRPTAVAYITSKPEWTGATVATRALVGDVLEMVAGITQVLLLVLT